MATKKPSKEISEIRDTYDILVIGSGGTGTYFLKEFSHYLARNKEAWSKVKSLTIADGDTVEEKNLDRQCFIEEDIGANKACAFASLLNDAMEGYKVSAAFNQRWRAFPEYITDKKRLRKLLDITSSQESYNAYDKVLNVRIPVIIGCVDNDACRLMCEELFDELDYCFYYDSGNDFSTGEVVYAHKFKGKKLSFEKSYSFQSMRMGKVKHVTEMSCAELNTSAPQHILTNMVAAQWLLRGMINLFRDSKTKNVLERIQNQLGYVFFDAFSGVSEFTERSYLTESENRSSLGA